MHISRKTIDRREFWQISLLLSLIFSGIMQTSWLINNKEELILALSSDPNLHIRYQQTVFSAAVAQPTATATERVSETKN